MRRADQQERTRARHGWRDRAIAAMTLVSVTTLADRASAQDVLAPAAWLGGCWESTVGTRVSSEQWMAPRGGLMTGMSRTVVRDTAREYEYLRIQARGGRVAYVAQPAGQAETTFPATLLSDTLLVFSNPAHDFPQQISYRKLSRDSLVARIEGPQGGQVRGINFPMRRAPCGGNAPAIDAQPVNAVRSRLLARIAQVPGAQVAIAVHDLASGRRLSIDGDTVFHAASTMKVPVLFALFREFESGERRADERMRLQNQFRSIVDQSPYALNAADDSDSSVYGLVGQEVSLRDLVSRMITHSSNLATNALITRLDPARITALTRRLGATQMQVLRGVEDNVAFRAGLNNTTTANDLVALFTALQEGRVADATGTRDMLAILEAQAFNDEIPAGLPAGMRVAHKTGSITATLHDAGLVFPPGRAPYAVAVLTRGIPNQAVASALIADCSRLIWEWLATPPHE